MAIAERLLAEHFNRPGPPDRGSPHLGVRQRRRPHGRGRQRGRLARRAPAARQAHRDLRRQPHHHRRRHRALLLARTSRSGSRHTAGSDPGRRRERPRRDRRGAARPRSNETIVRRSSCSAPYIADPAPTKRDTRKAHGAPLGAEEVRRTKEIMGWPDRAPVLRARGRPRLIGAKPCPAAPRSRPSGATRLAAYAAARPEAGARSWSGGCRARCRTAGTRPARRSRPTRRPLATRQASGLALQAIAAAVPNLVGGSADLGGSTGTTLKQGGTFGPAKHAAGPSTGACGSTAWPPA